MLEYLTGKEAREKWGITSRMVNDYCSSGRFVAYAHRCRKDKNK